MAILEEPFHRTRFGSLNERSLAMTQEIHHLTEEQLLNGIQKLEDHCPRVCRMRWGLY